QKFSDTFNDLVDKVNDLTHFDTDPTKRGILLGDPTVSQIQDSLYAAFLTVVPSAGKYRLLSDIGLSVGTGGKLTFDADKFRTAYATDPDSAQKLFTALQTNTAAGATTNTKLGVAYSIQNAIKSLNDPVDGVITRE